MLCWLALLLAASLAAFPAHAADRTIYRCVLAGISTFSDRPCGDSIEAHSLDVPDVPAAVNSEVRTASVPEPSRVTPKRARAPSRDANLPNQKDSRAKDCVRLDVELRRLSARMRAGYSAAEGERLRERQRMARERRRDLQCR